MFNELQKMKRTKSFCCVMEGDGADFRLEDRRADASTDIDRGDGQTSSSVPHN